MRRMIRKQIFAMYAKRRLKSACAFVQSHQSSLSAWWNFASLAIQNTPSEDSDQTAQMCMLIWIFAGHMSESRFSNVVAHLYIELDYH